MNSSKTFKKSELKKDEVYFCLISKKPVQVRVIDGDKVSGVYYNDVTGIYTVVQIFDNQLSELRGVK